MDGMGCIGFGIDGWRWIGHGLGWVGLVCGAAGYENATNASSICVARRLGISRDEEMGCQNGCGRYGQAKREGVAGVLVTKR